MDLDTQLDSLSPPPPTPPHSSPDAGLQGESMDRHHAPAQVPTHMTKPLLAHGPHLQHMGLTHVPDTIAVTRTDGKKVSMRRRVMPLYGTCHYAVRAKPTQTGPFKATAALALQAWTTKHGHTLLQESQDELAAILERVPLTEAMVTEDTVDDSNPAPTPPPYAQAEPLEEQALPSWAQLEALAALDIATQRHIPKQLHAALQSTALQLLHSSVLERDNCEQGQPVPAHLLYVLPKLLWPQPRAEHEGPMATRTRLRLIRQRIHLLQQGRYQDLVDLA
eukprot:2283119-Amphidinium_carterae.1